MTVTPFFDRLRADAAGPWARYVQHPFVLALGDGSLSERKFREFLVQDYLFLIQYARAYVLLAYKLDEPADMRAALTTADALLTGEMPLHVRYCAGWGLDEAQMRAAPAALEMIAYTRYVLELGQAGDALDLMVALAPCIAGYAEIGAMLNEGLCPGNPYTDWIAAYAGPDYNRSVAEAMAMLERLAVSRGGAARYDALLNRFIQATECEAAFWEIGWRAGAKTS
ncbi:MAG TPA: TenA family protein [Acidocella sp.]|jgi:thiaminase/transcriptional activator TenA|uniref:TenA family protein n=1 Tax=Acidocella sp. TaxID=50710 RepID=UPI002B69E1BD|nr:TenA family protein [Acidocella sp.]HVE21861.1 TenA family protein [Acidocella sp.]